MFVGLSSMAITSAFGTTSRMISNRFAPSWAVSALMPVILPPGRLRLATMPSLIGSPPMLNTIGIVLVAPLAASGAGAPPCATIRDTGRPTSSVAIAGSRSNRPSAQRYSIVTF
jgi:hypothetical protein